MTADISAYLFDPRQHYTGVGLQQGRVITDTDWNEDGRIEADRRRRLLSDLICGHGSTNAGFRPVSAGTATVETGGDNGTEEVTTVEVRLAPGSFLLGGELHDWPAGDVQTSLVQPDWLQLTGEDSAELPSAPEGERTDLVYLEAFEQTVTAVEDRELRERALGGPDTSTRSRAARRVRVLVDTAADRQAASAAMRAAVTAPVPGDTSGQPHGFDPVTCEVLSKARLIVGFSGPGPTQDLCKPRVTQGYLGAENQAIRVQLTRADRFVWAYDNAAPLFRVQVTNDAPEADGSVEITLMTPPADPQLFPLEEMVVEILPWGAVLANLEKVADRRGHLARVTAAYDPGTSRMRIAPAVPAAMLNWLGSTRRDPILSPRDPVPEQRFLYMRLWQPGPEGGATLDHPFQPGTAVVLPGTGLELTFSAFGLPGDHWIAAARPNTPDRVVPWRLLDAAPPFGPKRFYAPLGLVLWRADANGNLSATTHDCRHRFRKLCTVETCCTVHVGDGTASTGDTTDLQAAIDMLPPEGGRICLLPGVHQAQAAIDGAREVTITGCGRRSVLVPFEGQTAPVIAVRNARLVALGDFAIESATTPHVTATRAAEVALSRLHMTARDRAAILGTRLDGWRMEDCTIQTLPLDRTRLGQNLPIEPAAFLSGNRLAVRRSTIETQAGGAAALTALGGLQIGGDSTDVEISHCRIRGGNGAGITLGSVDFQARAVLRDPQRLTAHYVAHTPSPTHLNLVALDDEGCPRLEPRPRPAGGDDAGEPLFPVSDGPVVDCRITANRIHDMGASGITVAFWFDPEDEEDAIVTDRLTIEGNEILRCMRLPVARLSEALREVVAFGGITLAVGREIAIHDNRITELATGHDSPICGIFALDVTAIAIQRNHLRDNGRIAALDTQAQPGRAGGIVLALVRPGIDFVETSFDPDQAQARQDGAAACVVEDNMVVAREGRALTLVGVGPMVVHGNRLTAHGSSTLGRILQPGSATNGFNIGLAANTGVGQTRQQANPLLALLDRLGGAAVAILNLGLSNEVYLQLLGFSGLGLVDPPQQQQGSFDDDIRLLANGNVLFNDNQVSLDSVSPAVTLTFSSILILSLDDVAVEDNQCDCDMGLDFVAVNAAVLGWSVRMQGNRMKEGLINAFLSGLTAGLFNDTSHNQGTHCFVHVGSLQPRVQSSGLPANASVTLQTNRHLVPSRFCAPFKRAEPQLAAGVAIQPQDSITRIDQ